MAMTRAHTPKREGSKCGTHGSVACGRTMDSKKSGEKTPGVTGDDEEIGGLSVDLYLVVFLKFIASIVPTIEVDSTTSF